MKMSDRAKADRPREKLQARGAGALSDYGIIGIETGTVFCAESVPFISISFFVYVQEYC